MIIIDLLSKVTDGFRVFTLDTGRLPQETHEMIDIVRRRYGVTVEVVSPDPVEVASMVAAHGTNLFYESVELRTLCCEIRKVRPLERKLRQLDAWITGMRRTQEETRAGLRKVEESEGPIKINPLADWTTQQVNSYIQEHSIPLHPLYACGYASIGCAPCTRAAEPGEPERAGRWWWENGAHKECGIHFAPDGAVRRTRTATHA
jgi:thioredoxin-dependent adenylylsulfate APS reductase